MINNQSQTFFISGRMPGLNELFNAAKGNWGQTEYTLLKKAWERCIAQTLVIYKIKPVMTANISFNWVEINKKRDPDNVSSGGRKLILDSMVKCGILGGDGWRYIRGWSDSFTINANNPGVNVVIDGEIIEEFWNTQKEMRRWQK